ncbi:MAG: copper oxidase [Methylotenera sp.]|uniref:multicopper oxidase family protein n=1 Tax=Methylotenera sp. TaxID=2051956 RepID=UPI0017F8D66D|nr:copper oxidase [Methylotenera sp.]NOU24538.1 copper oxidase [Methylotenera sp.]
MDAKNKFTRRDFFKLAGAGVALSAVNKVALAALPEIVSVEKANTQAPLQPNSGRPYNPVVTLNGWSLPWRMKNGVKEFHLVAEPVIREIAPGMLAHLWGYNGQSPGPTIEVVEGDRVRIFVTNRLPEVTSVHWHGQRLPNGMDGVSGLTQPAIPPGKTFVYEFEAKRAGTFMYHPHADEMTQMAMGLMGSWITHPKNPKFMAVDRDFIFLLNAYDIEPGSYTPKVNTMLNFNLWTWNSRAFPGIDPLVVRKNDRVRIRVGNLTMTNHPIHLHGHEFQVTGTDGGWIPASARWPEVTTDIGVGQMRAIEFVANEPGDWSLHCHKSHHTMNAMGHQVPTLIGVEQKDLVDKISNLVPDYMAMGQTGMAEMNEMASMMAMPIPENTLPMMTGTGQFGAIDMGGMFSVVKVREGLAKGNFKDPGAYKHPSGTVAFEFTGEVPEPVRSVKVNANAAVEVQVRKPNSHTGH